MFSTYAYICFLHMRIYIYMFTYICFLHVVYLLMATVQVVASFSQHIIPFYLRLSITEQMFTSEVQQRDVAFSHSLNRNPKSTKVLTFGEPD